jgi:diguanylate cyclase (GGDEF)-like protein
MLNDEKMRWQVSGLDPDIQSLKKENQKLCDLLERDGLTGIYNRGTSEEKISDMLGRVKSGFLFLIDVDYFRRINNLHGHIAGDELLKQIARILSCMILKNDILGRISGDEFVIYMPAKQDLNYAEKRAGQIRERLERITEQSGLPEFTISIGYSQYCEGDSYLSMFERADQKLIQNKRRRNRRNVGRTMRGEDAWMKKGIDIDMKRIRRELAEQELLQGAYCQDYDTFKSIYRFVERRLRRTQSSVYIILLTLTDGRGEFPELTDREDNMEILEGVIQNSLRLGDVFTQYSSCQFLIMASDVQERDAESIALRISNAFYREMEIEPGNLILHHCYPLKPAGEEE